jgi:hypothetical protein
MALAARAISSRPITACATTRRARRICAVQAVVAAASFISARVVAAARTGRIGVIAVDTSISARVSVSACTSIPAEETAVLAAGGGCLPGRHAAATVAAASASAVTASVAASAVTVSAAAAAAAAPVRTRASAASGSGTVPAAERRRPSLRGQVRQRRRLRLGAVVLVERDAIRDIPRVRDAIRDTPGGIPLRVRAADEPLPVRVPRPRLPCVPGVVRLVLQCTASLARLLVLLLLLLPEQRRHGQVAREVQRQRRRGNHAASCGAGRLGRRSPAGPAEHEHRA